MPEANSHVRDLGHILLRQGEILLVGVVFWRILIFGGSKTAHARHTSGCSHEKIQGVGGGPQVDASSMAWASTLPKNTCKEGATGVDRRTSWAMSRHAHLQVGNVFTRMRATVPIVQEQYEGLQVLKDFDV
jgi:hypothetical protein